MFSFVGAYFPRGGSGFFLGAPKALPNIPLMPPFASSPVAYLPSPRKPRAARAPFVNPSAARPPQPSNPTPGINDAAESAERPAVLKGFSLASSHEPAPVRKLPRPDMNPGSSVSPPTWYPGTEPP